MNKIKNIIISYWFNELTFNPKDKITDLEKELSSIFNSSFMYNEESINHLISMPRIQGISIDKKYLFQMSLINANISISVNDLEQDEIVMLINNNVQFFYDILKTVFNLKILYTSVKIEMVEEKEDAANVLAKKYQLEETYEDFSIKKGFIKDDYYINYILNSGKEFNFDIKRNDKDLEQDIFDRTLITSLSKAHLNKEFILKIIEINDRYAFNKDENYESTKENIRGMIIELKKILENKLYEKK